MTSILGNTRKPDVSFYRNGRIDITARVVKALGIEKGDVIDVAMDGDEYLLYVAHKGKDVAGAHEARCYPSNVRNTHNYRCHSKRLCEAMVAAVRTPLKCMVEGKADAGATGVVAGTPSAKAQGTVAKEALRLAAGVAYQSKSMERMVIPLITRMAL